MVPAEHDLREPLGADFTHEFSLFNCEEAANENTIYAPVSLFDTDVVISVKRYLSDSQKTLYTWDSASDPRVKVIPHEGTFLLSLSDTDVSVFEREHSYDVFLRDAAGRMICVVQGKIFPEHPF